MPVAEVKAGQLPSEMLRVTAERGPEPVEADGNVEALEEFRFNMFCQANE